MIPSPTMFIPSGIGPLVLKTKLALIILYFGIVSPSSYPSCSHRSHWLMSSTPSFDANRFAFRSTVCTSSCSALTCNSLTKFTVLSYGNGRRLFLARFLVQLLDIRARVVNLLDAAVVDVEHHVARSLRFRIARVQFFFYVASGEHVGTHAVVTLSLKF